MDLIQFNFDIPKSVENFGALPGQFQIAAKRSAVKVRNWLITQLRRELATQIKVPVGALRDKFKKGAPEGVVVPPGAAVLMIDLSAVEAQKIKNPTQTKSGVRVGSHFFKGAFVAKIYSSETKVWRRKGPSRFPVVKMTVPIRADVEHLLEKYEGPMARKFEEYFEHELKYEMGFFK